MGKTAAIFYERNGYETNGQRLLGRQSAGQGFLKGLVRHGQAEDLYCLAKRREDFDAFCTQIAPWSQRKFSTHWVPTENPGQLAQAGVLYRPDPSMTREAWKRRGHDPRAYSICGVTHTIASQAMIQSIGDLLLAPVQPWDAVICTSQSVKTAYERVLGDWGEYLVQRLGGGRPDPKLQLPVIPLGIDAEAFPTAAQQPGLRAEMRQKLGIGEGDIVILFVGRLIFYAKAHPIPMYLAVAQAAAQTGRNIHLLEVGWFENEREERAFQTAAKTFCTGFQHHFLDGREPEIRANIWSAADIFISLSDNIQETFGLTPLEAMANGLPVIVSDWDGYQESVRQGVEGFKIPTVMPPPGTGLDLAEAYLDESLNYSSYIAHGAMATAVDVPACREALVRLIENPDLRHRMGACGRQRIQSVYDWRVVIKAYEALWEELGEIRQGIQPVHAPVKPNAPARPLNDDPFRTFAHYGSHPLTPETRFTLGDSAPLLPALQGDWMANFGEDYRLPKPEMEALLQRIRQPEAAAGVTLATLLGAIPPELHPKAVRTLLHAAKLDVLRITYPADGF